MRHVGGGGRRCCEQRREREAKRVSVHTRLSNIDSCGFFYGEFVSSQELEYFIKNDWIKSLLGGEAAFLAACKGRNSRHVIGSKR